MAQEINLGGTIYISSKRAAEITGYTQDYVGQLARGGNILAQRVSGLWYVVEESLRNYKVKADEFKPTPPAPIRRESHMDSTVSFDGMDYVSAQRAAELTGYHPDYVGQLARNGKVLSRQVGNRWFVNREEVVEHKRHNDALLAAVQADSVGLMKEEQVNPEPPQSLHYSYLSNDGENATQLPSLDGEQESVRYQSDIFDTVVDDAINEIPIRVIKPHTVAQEPQPEARFRKSIVKYRGTRLVTLAIITAVVAATVIAVGYLYTFKRSVYVSSYVAITTTIQSSVARLPLEKVISMIVIPDSIQAVLSNEIYFRRDSF